jgi:hypothetical protein
MTEKAFIFGVGGNLVDIKCFRTNILKSKYSKTKQFLGEILLESLLLFVL